MTTEMFAVAQRYEDGLGEAGPPAPGVEASEAEVAASGVKAWMVTGEAPAYLPALRIFSERGGVRYDTSLQVYDLDETVYYAHGPGYIQITEVAGELVCSRLIKPRELPQDARVFPR